MDRASFGNRPVDAATLLPAVRGGESSCAPAGPRSPRECGAHGVLTAVKVSRRDREILERRSARRSKGQANERGSKSKISGPPTR
ncbi:hypothetical protein MRX96_007090 [Rhipicephalus microplus]